ncbi:MAG TPA: endonuclease/exonuclease/phosphatase family protein [Kiritimatiellia bacterium]|nr:endonuclease/exonuclease/phosphatase family protein [Kiritimatiellia bacterium]
MKQHSILPLFAVLLLAFATGAAKSAAAGAAAAPPAPFFVANWNVENLYDTEDDPDNEGDDEFLPNNVTTRWTQVRYETKLDNLAQVISGMNGGAGPDVLGLEEVENEDVVRDLAERLPGKRYGIVHVDSPDPRGIDTAMLFDRGRFTLLESHAYKVPLKWGETRDILHAVLEDRDGEELHVLVNHWPSRGGGVEESEMKRVVAARTLAKAIERIYRREPAPRIVVLGDFNDTPSDRSIRDVLDVEFYPSDSGKYDSAKIYNLASGKAKQGQGSFFHAFDGKVEWRMYDQIMASGALLQNAGGRRSEISLWVDKPAFMVEEHGWDKGSPVPTFQGQEDYEGGYSDHFPVGVRFAYLDDAPAAAKPAPEKPVPAAAKPAAPAPAKVKASAPDESARRAEPVAAQPKRAPAKPARPAPANSSALDEPVVW